MAGSNKKKKKKNLKYIGFIKKVPKKYTHWGARGSIINGNG